MFSSRILKTSLVALALCGAATIPSMPAARASEAVGIWNRLSDAKVQYVRDRVIYRNGRRVYVQDRRYGPSYRYRNPYNRYAPRRAYPRVYAPNRGAYWYPERPRPGRTDRALEQGR